MKWFKELVDEALQGPIGAIIIIWMAIFLLFAVLIIGYGIGWVK